jgi:hypothetical protein
MPTCMGVVQQALTDQVVDNCEEALAYQASLQLMIQVRADSIHPRYVHPRLLQGLFSYAAGECLLYPA